MTFTVQRAARRTFIIERRGTEYVIVEVFEKGHQLTQADMASAMTRVLNTDPDERIVAEQSVSITPTPNGPVIQAEDAATLHSTIDSAQRLLRGERPA